jgi:DUF4097 and DUF4098 domain-containing protein YvlB
MNAENQDLEEESAMRNQWTICLLSTVVLLLSISVLASAQDFQKSYPVSSGGSVNIKNVSGNITITGSNTAEVTVSGFKEGRDAALISVEDSSSGNTVDVRVQYPRNCRCNASINFEISVPQGADLNFASISTASGDIKVQNVTGNLNLRSASGNVTVQQAVGRVVATSASGDVRVTDVAGSISASTASGNVEARMNSISGSDSMEFSSASGDVRVWAPQSLDADVTLTTSSGSLDSDFALQMEEHEHGPARSAHGRVGSGARSLRISTASGNVSLKRVSG